MKSKTEMDESKAREGALKLIEQIGRMAQLTGDTELVELTRRGQEEARRIKEREDHIRKLLAGEDIKEEENPLHSHHDTSGAAKLARSDRVNETIDRYLDLVKAKKDPQQGLGDNSILQFAEDMLSDDMDVLSKTVEKSPEADAFRRGIDQSMNFFSKRRARQAIRITLVKDLREFVNEAAPGCDVYEFLEAKRPQELADVRVLLAEEHQLGEDAKKKLIQCGLLLLRAISSVYGRAIHDVDKVTDEFVDELLATCPKATSPRQEELLCSVCVRTAAQVWAHEQRLHPVCDNTKCQRVLVAMGCYLLTPIMIKLEASKAEFKVPKPEPTPERREFFERRVAEEVKKRFGITMPMRQIKQGAVLNVPDVPGKSRDEVDREIVQIVAAINKEIQQKIDSDEKR